MSSTNQQQSQSSPSPFSNQPNFGRQPQILIDPNTGQQYIIPAPQPQIYYQPVYIPTPQNGQGQQLYYTPQGNNLQSSPFILQPTSSPGYLYNPRGNNGTNVSTPIITSQQNQSNDPNQASFTSDAFSRLSNGSSKDSTDNQTGNRNLSQGNLLTTTFAQMKISQQQNRVKKGSMEQLAQQQQQQNIDDSTGRITNSITRPSLNWNSPRRDISNILNNEDISKTTPNSPTKFSPIKRTPFHGMANYNMDNKMGKNNVDDKNNIDTTPVVVQKPVRMDFDFNKITNDDDNKDKQQQKTPVCRVPPTAFTISFDDDTNGDSNPNKKSNKPKNLQEARMKKLNSKRNEHLMNGGNKINNKKNNSSDKDSTGGNEDPKRYLLTKLLQGSGGKTTAKMIPANLLTNSLNNKSIGSIGRGEDTLSDAGTYVVTNDNGKEMSMSKVIDSEDEGDSVHRSDSECNYGFNEEDEDDYRSQSPISHLKRQNNDSHCSTNNETYSDKSNSTNGTIRSGNLCINTDKNNQINNKNTLHSPTISNRVYSSCGSSTTSNKRDSQISIGSNSGGGNKKSTSSSMATNKTTGKISTGRILNTPSVVVKQTVASKARQALSHPIDNSKESPRGRVTNLPATTTTNNVSSSNFRRADGGRFSMRGSGTSFSSTPTPKPPFKTGVASARGTSTASPRESTEFAAWLRRKDYNPMKAAAEAKKMKELKSRTDNYASSRSISFHHGATTSKDSNMINKGNLNSRFSSSNSKLINNTSLKDNDIMMTSMDSINEDDDGIQRNSLHLSSSQYTSSNSLHLSKAVDELTSKCQKSIQLIKLFSGQGLSESMENLIEDVISPDSIDKESNKVDEQQDLGHRLDNLNTAFDAIQKCLEGFHKEIRLGSPMAPRRPTSNSIQTSSPSIKSGSSKERRDEMNESRHSYGSLGSSEDSEKLTY
uniref:J domain-containing protein n=1 Tax=Parastrongyloides trichosuri TaxID=131310 RepID=A0A0N4ZK83_PARTI